MSVQRWDHPQYRQITSVERNHSRLHVSFANGTTVSLTTDQLLPAGAVDPVWEAMDYDTSEITVPTSSGTVEIPWSTVRLLTDQEFAAHWAHTAGEQARQVGLHLRALRKNRQLSSKEVAERAGITPQSLSRIELGHHDIVFTTLRKILAAMGCTLQDLAEIQVSSCSTPARTPPNQER